MSEVKMPIEWLEAQMHQIQKMRFCLVASDETCYGEIKLSVKIDSIETDHTSPVLLYVELAPIIEKNSLKKFTVG
jgi:hypothetical protein